MAAINVYKHGIISKIKEGEIFKLNYFFHFLNKIYYLFFYNKIFINKILTV